eukprot:gene328-1702_t
MPASKLQLKSGRVAEAERQSRTVQINPHRGKGRLIGPLKVNDGKECHSIPWMGNLVNQSDVTIALEDPEDQGDQSGGNAMNTAEQVQRLWASGGEVGDQQQDQGAWPPERSAKRWKTIGEMKRQ